MYNVEAVNFSDASSIAESVFPLVFRTSFEFPGFAVINFGQTFGSANLRRAMLHLKADFSRLLEQRFGKSLRFLSMGRFDQQVTTKFHLDGAPDQSVLILGYEPSNVRSRLLMADYTRCANDLTITPQQFLDDHNPMFAQGAKLLENYVTELSHFDSASFQIVVINNSSRPYTREGVNLLGVMHKAEILNPNSTERRIVNSTMLYAADNNTPEEYNKAAQDRFANTSEISGPVKKY